MIWKGIALFSRKIFKITIFYQSFHVHNIIVFG